MERVEPRWSRVWMRTHMSWVGVREEYTCQMRVALVPPKRADEVDPLRRRLVSVRVGAGCGRSSACAELGRHGVRCPESSGAAWRSGGVASGEAWAVEPSSDVDSGASRGARASGGRAAARCQAMGAAARTTASGATEERVELEGADSGAIRSATTRNDTDPTGSERSRRRRRRRDADASRVDYGNSGTGVWERERNTATRAAR